MELRVNYGLVARAFVVAMFLKRLDAIEEARFCHEAEMEWHGGATELRLDASYDVTNAADSVITNASQRCTCQLTSLQEPIATDAGLVIQTLFKHDVADEMDSVACRRRVDLMYIRGAHVLNAPMITGHSFGCAEDAVKYSVYHGDRLEFTLTSISGTSLAVKDDRSLILQIYTSAEARFKLSCGPPEVGVNSTKPSTSASSTTSTTTTMGSTTTITSVTPTHGGAIDTGVLVGVLVGVGIVCFLILVCLLYCIVSRRKQDDGSRDVNGDHSQPTLTSRVQQSIRVTVATLYHRVKQRPLPSIPKSLRKSCRPVSGLYDSIRSNGQRVGRLYPPRIEELQDDCVSIQSTESYTKPYNPYIIATHVDLEADCRNSPATVCVDHDLANTATESCTDPPYTNHSGDTCTNTTNKLYANANGCLNTTGVNDSASKHHLNIDTTKQIALNTNGYLNLPTNVTHTVKSPKDLSNQDGPLKSPVFQVNSHGYVPMKATLKNGANCTESSTDSGTAAGLADIPVKGLVAPGNHEELFPDMMQLELSYETADKEPNDTRKTLTMPLAWPNTITDCSIDINKVTSASNTHFAIRQKNKKYIKQ